MALRQIFAARFGLRLIPLLLFLPLLAGAGALASAGGAATSGLVAAYAFDDGSGTSATDATGNAHTGTVNGATWTTGHSGGALLFNGTSSYVSVPDASTLDLSNGMTLEAWVDPTASSTGYGAVIAKDRSGGGLPYGLEVNGGTPDGYVNTGASAAAAAASALPVNTWTHLAVTYDGTNLTLYVNGTQAATQLASGLITASSDPLRIGADLTWGEFFKGKIDDVRVYSRALTASAIQTDMKTPVTLPPAPAVVPVASYAFDEGSGTTANDASGGNDTGTATGATWVAGHTNDALAFDGSSNYVTVPDTNSLDLSSGATVEAWVYPTGGTGFQSIVAKERSGGGLPYGLELNGATPDGYVNTGSNVTATGPSALPQNTWTHLAMTYDGSNVKLYVNGTVVSTTAASGTIVASSDPLRIGADLTWGEYFDGRIDDVRVYSQAITQAQVQTDMTTPVPGTTVTPPPPGDTQAPTTPSGLKVGSTSQTDVLVSWSASSDNVGVTGYDVYKNGTVVGNTAGTSLDVTGLSCGSTYTLAVDAYDAAGNHSGKASISATTSACSTPSATVYVAPNGSDSNSCSQSAPCQSFDRAYHVAQPGQVVQVAGGTYPEQSLLYDSTKAGATQHVVFQPAPGASVTINGNINASYTRTVKGASHFTVQNMTVLGDIDLEGCGVPDGTACPSDQTAGSSDITLQNLRVKGSYAFVCHSCTHIQILGGTYGPDSYLPCHNANHPEVSPQSDGGGGLKLKRPSDILIDGTRWQNFARCSSGDHTECLQFEPADYVTIRNSVFTHCDTITLAFFTSLAGDSKSSFGYAATDHIVIENNFIDQSYDATGGPTWNGLQFDSCTNCIIRYNSWLQNTHLPQTTGGAVSINNLVEGNVGVQSDCGSGGITFLYNVFKGAACGSTDKNVSSLGFVDPSSMDLHLTSTSPAINAGNPNDYPAKDIDGTARPLGGLPDAGADEAR